MDNITALALCFAEEAVRRKLAEARIDELTKQLAALEARLGETKPGE